MSRKSVILLYVCYAVGWMWSCTSVFVEYILYTTKVKKVTRNCFSGTGKSHVIVNLILQILYGQKQYRKHDNRRNVPRILICAPSNAAIDELVIRLLRIRQTIQSKCRICLYIHE